MKDTLFYPLYPDSNQSAMLRLLRGNLDDDEGFAFRNEKDDIKVGEDYVLLPLVGKVRAGIHKRTRGKIYMAVLYIMEKKSMHLLILAEGRPESEAKVTAPSDGPGPITFSLQEAKRRRDQYRVTARGPVSV